MRLAAFDDAIYHRDAAGLTVHRAFPLFMFGLADQVDELRVLGRVDPRPARSHYVLPDGAMLVALPWYESLTDVRAVLRALRPTIRLLWRTLGEVDTVWVNGPGPTAIVVALVALARRCRLVVGVRQDTRAYGRARYPGRHLPAVAFGAMESIWRALARVRPVTTVGPELLALYAHAPRRHELAVSFVPEASVASELPLAAGPDPEVTTVLSVGRLDTEKNPLMLADVAQRLGPGFRLRIVGEGPLEGELRERIADLGVDDRVELLGYVPLDGGLLDHYRGADVFLHVSWTEGLPQVLLEAFAARLPVVATSVGGVEAVASGAALLVGPGDPQAAADAVRRLAGDPELRERLAAQGLERVRARTTEAEQRRLVAFLAAA